MCCGKNRSQVQAESQGFQFRRSGLTSGQGQQVAQYFGSTFQYLGPTGLTVIGPVTGRRYRFDRPGSRVDVDPRDRASVASIPMLKLVVPSPSGL